MNKIYKFNLCVDVRLTRKALRSYFKTFNEALKKKSPDQYKLKRIKAAQIHTLFSAIDFYSAQLYDAKKQNRHPGTFRTNNQKLARRTGCSDTTVWRHLSRFMQPDMNIIMSKTTHGPKADYELFFNPEFLVAQKDAYFNNFVKYHYGNAFKMNQIPIETLKAMADIRPSFMHAHSGIYLISLCKLIDTRTFNFNMKQGIVEFAALLENINASAINSEFNNNNNIQLNLPEQPSLAKSVPKKPEQFCARKNQNYADENIRQKRIDTHVFLAWNYARKMLWPLITFTHERNHDILRRITTYFHPDDSWKNRPMIDLNSFCEIITLVYRYLQRKEGRFVPVPELFFDPMFKDGFMGAKKWHEKVLATREKNKEFYYNHQLLIACYRNYTQYPGITNYNKGRQLLSRKREKWLLEEYDKLILGISEMTHQPAYLYEKYSKLIH